MITALTIIHGIICFFLIVVVLLQFGKGAELGATMGGASQSIFSSSQKGNILTKITSALALLFLINSVALSLIANKKVGHSVMEKEASSVPLNQEAMAPELSPTAEAVSTSQPANPKTK